MCRVKAMGFCNSTHFSALPRPAAVSGDPAIANCGLAAYAADLRSERLRVCEVNRFSLSSPPPLCFFFSRTRAQSLVARSLICDRHPRECRRHHAYAQGLTYSDELLSFPLDPSGITSAIGFVTENICLSPPTRRQWPSPRPPPTSARSPSTSSSLLRATGAARAAPVRRMTVGQR